LLIDIVMWTKNGESTLPVVLKQIDKVIPKQVVNKKIMIDDHSTDNTRQIGLNNHWIVITNEGNGISDAANTALKYVEAPMFCSFEQDLLLSNEWFNQVYPLVLQENVAIASGMRFPNGPSAVRKIKLSGHKDYLDYLSKLPNGPSTNSTHGKTLDNTVYKTDFVRSIGGFVYMKSNCGQDSSMSLKVWKSKKYVWKVNYSIISVHLKSNSYIAELKSQRWYARAFREIFTSNQFPLPSEINTKAFLFRFARSPSKSIKLLKRTKDPSVLFYYPAFCLVQLIGLIEGKRYEHARSMNFI
jgi:glycosyltransferase involved in cell wall biosynthesis